MRKADQVWENILMFGEREINGSGRNFIHKTDIFHILMRKFISFLGSKLNKEQVPLYLPDFTFIKNQDRQN